MDSSDPSLATRLMTSEDEGLPEPDAAPEAAAAFQGQPSSPVPPASAEEGPHSQDSPEGHVAASEGHVAASGSPLPEDPAAVESHGGDSDDGERISYVKKIQIRFERYRHEYGHLLSAVRPWGEFIRLSQPKGCDDVLYRIQSNLRTYWANYAIVALVLLGCVVMLSLPSLVVVIALGATWHSFLRFYMNPASNLRLCRLEVKKYWLMLALLTITLVAISIFVAPLFILVGPLWLFLIAAHGILHPIVDAAMNGDCISSVERGEMTRVLDAPEDEVAPATDQAE